MENHPSPPPLFCSPSPLSAPGQHTRVTVQRRHLRGLEPSQGFAASRAQVLLQKLWLGIARAPLDLKVAVVEVAVNVVQGNAGLGAGDHGKVEDVGGLGGDMVLLGGLAQLNGLLHQLVLEQTGVIVEALGVAALGGALLPLLQCRHELLEAGFGAHARVCATVAEALRKDHKASAGRGRGVGGGAGEPAQAASRDIPRGAASR